MAHDLLGSLDGSAVPDVPQCSRRGCRQDAAWRLEWNNPRIHAPERRKTWLACADHRDWLQEYLTSRGLFKDVLPLETS